MPENDSSPIQNCSTCGAEVDVAQFEPLASVTCPVCNEPMVVCKTLGPYDLVEVMGRGGMGVVYRAIDHQLDRQVALKVLRDDHFANAEFVRKLDEEAAITGGINHPHVVKVYTTGTVNGRFFISMELVDQGTLDDLLEIQGRVAESQALEIASQIAQGLRAAHQLGLIHRDVKPGNILFSENHQAKIVDFGLAMLEEASKGTGEIWGTPYYVSPERLDQKPEDFRSDMYSLGATIFHAIAGRPPFEAEDATRVALKHLKSQAVSLQAFAPWVSGSTAFVINRMLNKDPLARYDSYDELIEHLEYARAELGADGAKPVAKKRVVLETDEDRKMWGQLTFAVLAFIVLVAAGIGAYFAFFAPGAKPTTPGAIAAASVGANGKYSASFEAARKLLLENKPSEAAAAFHKLSADAPPAQPLHHWSVTHEALAHLLAGGHLDKAQDLMRPLLRQKLAATTPAARLQSEFFDKLAALTVDEKTTKLDALSEFNRNSYGALASLFAGLKDWEVEDFENAYSALRGFQSATPTGEFAWISDYRPLVDDHVADLSTFRGAMALAKSAKTQAEHQNVATTLPRSKADLRRPDSVLGVKMDQAAQYSAKKAKEMPVIATAVDQEKAALAAARTKAATLAKQWSFREAQAALSSVPVTNNDIHRERRAMLKKLGWLQQYKGTLIKDLGNGYSGEVKLVNGSAVGGAVVKADERGVQIENAGPSDMHAWGELSPESIVAMGESFITPELPPAQAAERRWGLGLVASLNGRPPVAHQLFVEAAKANPQYAESLPYVTAPRRSDLARLKTTVLTASDPTSIEAPANAIDGKQESKWASKAPGPKWLRLDLGKPCNITRWVLKHASPQGDPAESYTSDFALQQSADDVTWKDVDVVQSNKQSATDRRVARFSARYVRVLITKPNRLPGDNPLARIYSFELYGWDGPGEMVQDFWATPAIAAVPEFLAHDVGLGPADSSGQTVVDDRTGTFSIHSSADGFSPKSDHLRFLHTPMRRPGQIVVRLDTVDKGEAGVMIRDGIDADARFVYAGHPGTGDLMWKTRLETGGEITEVRGGPARFPCWLRLEMKGSEVVANWSEDGARWLALGTGTIDYGGKAEIGVAAMSRPGQPTSVARLEVINFLR